METYPLIPGELIAKLLRCEKQPNRARELLESQGVKVWASRNVAWFVQGLTFGAYPGTSQAIFRPVIREFLAEHRTCEITGGWLLVDPWWEFEYQCWISQQTAPGQWPTAPEPAESEPLEPTAGP